MKKRLSKFMVSVLTTAMIMTSLPVNQLVVQAGQTVVPETLVEVVKSVSNNGMLGDEMLTEEVILPVYEATSGTLGDNNGIRWNYDVGTKTLAVTGEDTGRLGNSAYGSVFADICSDVEHIVIKDCKLYNCSYLFKDLKNLQSVTFENFDTSQVTTMREMFCYCSSLLSLDASELDTSNVTDMESMFFGCISLNDLDISGFNTSQVTSMKYMFASCSSLSSLDVSSFDTSQVTNMFSMFYNCFSLTELDLSSFNTSQVTNMGCMFAGLTETLSLKNLDLSNFDTSNVTNMACMFTKCAELTYLDVSKFDTSKVTDMAAMFGGCSSLSSLDISSFETANVTDMGSMFYGCSRLSLLDLHNFDIKNVTDMSFMFKDCSDLETINTPKSIANGQSIELPADFYDSEMNLVQSITSQYCNKTLVKHEKYTITYYLNGGKNNVANPAIYVQGSAAITLKSPTRTGYTFSGWYSDSGYKTKVSKIKTDSNKDVKLYAKWTPNQYTIKFAKNGATSGNMKAMKNCKYGTSHKLTANAYKRKGYSFSGWNTKADGTGTAYKNKASVKNLTVTNGKTITLYAQWKKDSYKITYKLNGGKNNKSNPAIYTVTSAVTLKKPTRTGYTFAGWYSDNKYKNKVNKISKGSTGKKILYAKWTPNKYTIKFNGNGATGGKMKNMLNRKYGTSYKLTANAYQKKGYKFTGWNTKKNGKGKAYKNKASVKNLVSTNGGTITLYAQWKKK